MSALQGVVKLLFSQNAIILNNISNIFNAKRKNLFPNGHLLFSVPFKPNFELYFVQFVKDWQIQLFCSALHTVCFVDWCVSFLFEQGSRTLN